MEDLKNLAIVVLVVAVLWWFSRKKGCSCGCTKEQSHPKADDRRPPSSAGGVRAKAPAGCSPFACGAR